MIYSLKPNPPDNVLISYIVFFIIFIFTMLITYVKNLNILNDNVSINRFLYVSLEVPQKDRIRELESFNIIQSKYVSKFLNLKNLGVFESITASNTTIISHRFFKNLEYSIAECILNMAVIIDEHRNDIYIDNIYKIKILNIITDYEKVFKTDKRSLISLYFRILQNLCHIENINCYKIVNIIKAIFEHHFKIKIIDLIKYCNDYNVFNNNLAFWHSDLFIHLKNLSKLNLTFLNVK